MSAEVPVPEEAQMWELTPDGEEIPIRGVTKRRNGLSFFHLGAMFLSGSILLAGDTPTIPQQNIQDQSFFLDCSSEQKKLDATQVLNEGQKVNIGGIEYEKNNGSIGIGLQDNSIVIFPQDASITSIENGATPFLNLQNLVYFNDGVIYSVSLNQSNGQLKIALQESCFPELTIIPPAK